ncbi:alcohol dehydrogenase [Enterococcus florum]|uniref:Alcohol dehydrogenase n=1 Tax=Enterococcus florum TaxID=2480627 RepID=A0A4V0WPH6_9ENTE|nr:NADP-dependent oxidoreductase [Enterococcus florum]GCF93889.1 alcohol dehydrogenase [Enterococcus florum]
MKRFAITEYGRAKDVFTEMEAEPRTVDATHVRVELAAFGVNPYDVSLRQGQMREVRSVTFPYVLGNDGAGIVTEVGDEISHVTVGDKVIVHAVGGTYGAEIVVPGKKVVKKPESMDWTQAAGAVTPWLTAYNLVTHVLGEKIGETVVVQGASGAVGSFLVQLLKSQGKTVYGTASAKNEALVSAYGVDKFAAYDKVDVGELFRNQADTVIDATKGSRTAESGIKIMRTGGHYVALNQLPENRQKEGTYLHFAPSKDYSDQEALSSYVELFDKKKLTVTIARVLPFTLGSVISAHEELEGHPSAGKIVIEREDK